MNQNTNLDTTVNCTRQVNYFVEYINDDDVIAFLYVEDNDVATNHHTKEVIDSDVVTIRNLLLSDFSFLRVNMV